MTVNLTKPQDFRYMRPNHPDRPAPHIELNFAITPEDHDEYETCQGHETTQGAIGSTFFCDGTCRPSWTSLIRI